VIKSREILEVSVARDQVASLLTLSPTFPSVPAPPTTTMVRSKVKKAKPSKINDLGIKISELQEEIRQLHRSKFHVYLALDTCDI
jgi:hypothetical protein